MNHTTRGKRNPRTQSTAARQAGVSLIEVLVSVLVVTTGLLGAAAMQATAVRNNQGSYERTQTAILAQGMFDAMRANLAGVAGNAYNTGGYICTAPTGTTLASGDLTRWVATLQQQVHSGACGSINCAANVCTVNVRWDDSRATGGGNAQVVSLRAQL